MAASEELDVAGVKPATAGDELVRASQGCSREEAAEAVLGRY